MQCNAKPTTINDNLSSALSVVDSGPGIPEDQLDKVTRRFFRIDESRGKPGSGLGLSLVQGIADYHDAKLHLSNSAQGLKVEVVFTDV